MLRLNQNIPLGFFMDLKWASRGPVKANSLLRRGAGRGGFGAALLDACCGIARARLPLRNRLPRRRLHAGHRPPAKRRAAGAESACGAAAAPAASGAAPARACLRPSAWLRRLPAPRRCDWGGLRLEEKSPRSNFGDAISGSLWNTPLQSCRPPGHEARGLPVPERDRVGCHRGPRT